MGKKKEAYKLLKNVMETFRETNSLMPDEMEIKLKFDGANAEMTYVEYFTGIPEEEVEEVIKETVEMLKQNFEKMHLFLSFECSVLPHKNGIKITIKGHRTVVLSGLLCELLAQLTLRDVFKVVSAALMIRGSV
jgi:hypothetical protein